MTFSEELPTFHIQDDKPASHHTPIPQRQQKTPSFEEAVSGLLEVFRETGDLMLTPNEIQARWGGSRNRAKKALKQARRLAECDAPVEARAAVELHELEAELVATELKAEQLNNSLLRALAEAARLKSDLSDAHERNERLRSDLIFAQAAADLSAWEHLVAWFNKITAPSEPPRALQQ